jgi:hypothetical protein
MRMPGILPPKDPTVSYKRVFYDQPSGVKGDLMPLYQAIGKKCDVHPATIRAIAAIESDEKPFTKGGFPVVRFEVAHWKKHREATRTALFFDKAVNSNNLDERWQQFEAMRTCQEVPAILSHSFGLFQIMGFNYGGCGCATPEVFLEEMKTVEGQFLMLERLIKQSPALLGALRRKDAAKVALHYNGKAYARNKYDVRWAAASRSGGEGVWA